MGKKVLALALVLAGTIVVSGCTEERTIVGRWQANSSTYYFRQDGILFYRSSSGEKYSGRFYVDKSTDPLVVQARLQAMNGGGGTLNVKFQAQFLTANRMRVDVLDEARGNRVLMLSRTVGEPNAG